MDPEAERLATEAALAAFDACEEAWDAARVEDERAAAEGRVRWDDAAWATGGVLVDPRRSLPRIECADRFPSLMAEEALAALVQGNEPPALFRRDGALVCLGERDDGAPAIRELTLSDLRGRLDLAAYWVRTSERGRVAASSAPAEVVNVLWSVSPWKYFPVLDGIVAAPVYSKEGRLCGVPGYLSGARLYYHATGEPPALPGEKPTSEELMNARELLMEEFLGDFPFVDDASKANALALLLTPFVRAMVDGPVPMFFLDKPTPSTGASLLAEALISVFDPAQAVPTPAVQDPDEWRKSITALLLDGGSHVFLDNVNHRLNSAELAAAITAGVWKTRRLSTAETVTLPCRQIWVVTGNNLSATDELVNRACWIRLDAGVERPESREGFRHPHLLRWVGTERRRLQHACLTLVQAWLAEGGPRMGIPWRTFTPWTEVLGGILAVAFVPGFLANREALRDKADTETQGMKQFVELWRDAHASQVAGVAELFEIASEVDGVSERLGDKGDLSRKTRLGRLLQRMEGRVYGGCRIERAGVSCGAVQYRLVAVEEA